MKPANLIAIGAALAGFSLGWLVKPSKEVAPAVVESAPETGKRPRGGMDGKSGERPERPLVLKSRVGKGSAEREEKTSEAERNFQVSFSSAGEQRRNAQVNRFTEALGLSDEQLEALKPLLEGRQQGFPDMKGAGKTPAEMVADAGNATRIFEAAVKEILDPEQLQAYEDLKLRKKENSIEAKASDDFADLVRQVDLSPSQREQALETLRELSAESVSKRPEGWDLMAETMQLMGGTYMSALEEMSGFMNDPEAMKNPAEIQKRMNEAHRANAAEKVARLTGILTPGQLAQFRATLEGRSTFRETSPVAPTPENR
jgi:hypothetical protein